MRRTLVALAALIALLAGPPPAPGQITQSFSVAPSGTAIFTLLSNPDGTDANVAALSDQREVHALTLTSGATGASFTLTLNSQTTAAIAKVRAPPPVYGQFAFTPSAGTSALAVLMPPATGYLSPAALVEIFDGDPTVPANFKGSVALNFQAGTGPSATFTDGTLNRAGTAPVNWMPLGSFSLSGGPAYVRVSGPDNKLTGPGAPDVQVYLCALRVAPATGSVTILGPAAVTNFSSTNPGYLATSAQPYDLPGPAACYDYAEGAGGTFALSPTAVQSALQALAGVGAGNVACSGAGTAASPLRIAYLGTFGTSSVPLVTSSDSGVVPSRVVAGDCWPYIRINGGSPIKLSSPYWGTGLGDAANPTVRTNNPYLPWVMWLLPQSAPAAEWEDIRAHSNSLASTGPGWGFAPSSSYAVLAYQSPGVGASATWRRDGRPPATYRYSATWPTVTGASTDVVYTATNRAGTVVGTWHASHAVVPDGAVDQGVPWHVLGSVTTTLPVDDLIVTLTNNSSGLMLADAVRFERTSSDTSIIIQPTDTVTVSAGVGWVSTGVPSGGSVAITGSAPAASAGTAVANLVGGSLFAPDPGTPKTMGVGWNINNTFATVPVQPYLNLMAAYQEPSPVIARTADGYPTQFTGTVASTGNCAFTIASPSPDVQGLGTGWPGEPPGRYTVFWDGASNVTIDGTEDPTRAIFTGTTANRRVFTVAANQGMLGPTVLGRVYSTSVASPGVFNCSWSNCRVYAGDLSTDPSGQFAPGFLAKIASAKSLRFLDPGQALAGNIQNYLDCDQPATRITKYGNPRIVTTAVASVGPGTSGWFDPTQGIVVLVTTSAPHSIGEGFFVTFPAALPTVTLSDGSTHPLSDYGNAGNAHVLTATTFEYQTGPALSITSGTTASTGSVSFSAGTYFPFSDAIAMCNLANGGAGADLYWNASHTETDACLFQMGVTAGTKLKAGLKVRLECGNEVWNYGFSATHYLAAASHGNHVGSGTGVAPYYVQLSNRFWTQFAAGMASVGRPSSDLIRVLGSQWSSGGVTESLAAEAARQGVNFDQISLAPYIDCQASPASGGGLEPSMGPLIDLATAAQCNDLNFAFQSHSGYQAINPSHLAGLDAHGFTHVVLGSYEGGPSSTIPYPEQGTRVPSRAGEKSHAAHRHPSYYRLLMDKFRQEQETGLDAPYHLYQLNGSGDQVIGGTFPEWTAYVGIGQAAGTGSLTTDTINLTSPDRVDLIKSEVGGAVDGWNGVVVAPTPPTPPTPHPPLPRPRPIRRRRAA